MESPWKNISTVQPTNLQNIMDEEYARQLQVKQANKFDDQLLSEYVICSKPNEEWDVDELELSLETTKSHFLGQVYLIPNYGNNIEADNGCVTDRDLAEALQSELNKVSKNVRKRTKRIFNKDTSVELAFTTYRNTPSDPEKKENEFVEKGDVDRLDDGCPVLDFSPDLTTEEAADVFKDLPLSVYNQLKSYSAKINKVHERPCNTEPTDMGLDEFTLQQLNNLIKCHILHEVTGVISAGKEAIILHAYTNAQYAKKRNLPRECVIKVFKSILNESHVPITRKTRNKKAETEMQSLRRMQDIGINCPKVILLKDNMLVMSFIGSKKVPIRTIKHALLDTFYMNRFYQQTCDNMKRMYNAKLIHGDITERNILCNEQKSWLIDLSQSIDASDKNAMELLMRDCKNVCAIFTRGGASDVKSPEGLFNYILGPSVQPQKNDYESRYHCLTYRSINTVKRV